MAVIVTVGPIVVPDTARCAIGTNPCDDSFAQEAAGKPSRPPWLHTPPDQEPDLVVVVVGRRGGGDRQNQGGHVDAEGGEPERGPPFRAARWSRPTPS
ncbi:hypothetical protein GCM10023336_05250 [Streptomyces similanensis]|uniref:Uncharacterized protein n=1 Tax=Streptomyces similanensis TaxID=1274988 RepID=A0ABP9JUI4_9ACTN